MHPIAKQLIERLELIPHPEGGFYKEIYRSTDLITTTNRQLQGQRHAATSIYYLLTGADISAWHRLTSDEIWHYYHGCPLIIYVLDKNGKLIQHRLGDATEVPNASFQVVIEANQWFAAQPDDAQGYTLIGCTVSPGFDFADFEIANEHELTAQYPQHAEMIKKFCRG